MDFPNLIHIAIPFFVGSILLEILISADLKTKNYEAKDALSSIAMGLGNVIIGLVGKGLVLGAYSLVHEFALFEASYTWWIWVLAFFAEDFTYYIYHRNAHNIRYFWASHVIHHSSRHYNLSTALRQTWTGTFSGSFVFWLWLPFIGFEPLMILFLQSISLLYQFWIHTEVIQKMPTWFELIFNTPSHHRVHHASDLRYLDKNHAGVLIIWDRLFGTFEAEAEKPTYGITNNIKSFNPLIIATHEWQSIFKDIYQYPRHFLGYLFGPPGWSHNGSRKTVKQLRTEKETPKAPPYKA